jgi:hypothetical protein
MSAHAAAGGVCWRTTSLRSQWDLDIMQCNLRDGSNRLMKHRGTASEGSSPTDTVLRAQWVSGSPPGTGFRQLTEERDTARGGQLPYGANHGRPYTCPRSPRRLRFQALCRVAPSGTSKAILHCHVHSETLPWWRRAISEACCVLGKPCCWKAGRRHGIEPAVTCRIMCLPRSRKMGSRSR